jgi:hypothetical protein
VQSVEGGYGATVGETGPEEPDAPIVPGARFYDLVPVRELPYGPAAPSLHQRPDRWQHPTTCRSSSKTACTWWGVHRWVHGLDHAACLLKRRSSENKTALSDIAHANGFGDYTNFN